MDPHGFELPWTDRPSCEKLYLSHDLENNVSSDVFTKVLVVLHIFTDDNIMYRN